MDEKKHSVYPFIECSQGCEAARRLGEKHVLLRDVPHRPIATLYPPSPDRKNAARHAFTVRLSPVGTGNLCRKAAASGCYPCRAPRAGFAGGPCLPVYTVGRGVLHSFREANCGGRCRTAGGLPGRYLVHGGAIRSGVLPRAMGWRRNGGVRPRAA